MDVTQNIFRAEPITNTHTHTKTNKGAGRESH